MGLKRLLASHKGNNLMRLEFKSFKRDGVVLLMQLIKGCLT